MRTLQINDVINMSGGFMKVPNNVYGLLQYKELGLKPGDILLYSVLLNRLNLSLANPEGFNRDGEVYVIYEQKDLCKELSLSNRGVMSSLERLEESKLIKITRLGKNKPNTYSFYDVFNMSTESLKCKILISRSEKNSSHEVRNSHPIKTDYIKTDYIKIKDTTMPEQPTETKASPPQEKEDKRYTALRDGGIACKIYSQEYELHFNEQHPQVEESKLEEIEERLQTFIEKESIDIMELPSIFEFYLTNLKNEKNGAIHYLAKDNHGYTPLLTKLLEEYRM